MILKKPYAFLIKNFKLIHFVLTVLVVYSSYKMVSIISFFDEYIKSGYRTNVSLGLGPKYVPSYLFFIVGVIIVLMITILVLLAHKKKGNKFYFFTVLYYSIVLMALIYVRIVLGGFEEALLEATTARSIRDISLILALPQVIVFIFLFLRTIGFNVKQFDFQKDLKELNLNAYDAEEIELNINFEGYKAKRTIRKIIRELLYYFKENKFIVMCVGIILIITTGFYLYNNIDFNQDNNYGINREFLYNNLNITIKDSILTNLDYNGNIIEKGKYYLVCQISISNKTGNTIYFDSNKIKLKYADIYILPDLSKSGLFIDFAPSNSISAFAPKANKTTSLVYEISENDIKKNFELQLYNGTIKGKKDEIDKNIYIKIKPKVIGEVKLNSNHYLGNEVSFAESIIGNATLKMEDYMFTNKYIYEYEKCIKNECNVYSDIIVVPPKRMTNTLMVINADLKIDETTNYALQKPDLKVFSSNFIKIQYKVGDEVFLDNSLNVTPSNKSGIIVFEVNNQINKASIIQAIVTIRNQKYIINLKS